MDRKLLADIFYGIGIVAILFTVIRTYLRLSRLKKDAGYARKKLGPDGTEGK
ncbi:MAG TPA: hypothetical protein VHE12_12135 [bacterium]|nr:hypothetical protein [bacterium]